MLRPSLAHEDKDGEAVADMQRENFGIDDGHGNRITVLSEVPTHARTIAQRLANERGESVWLYRLDAQEEEAREIEPEDSSIVG